MKQQILIALFVLSVMLFNSCTEKEDPAQITISDSSIDYFQNQMDFPADSGSKTIQFSTNKDWEIKLSESGMNVDWCTITPSTGTAGDNTVTIKVDENTTYDERNVIATLTAGDKSEKLRITQKQNDAILISSTVFEIPMEGSDITIEVKSNISYEVEIPEQYQSWIQSGTKTRGLSSRELQFKILENLDYDKREGEILISNGQITEVVKIYQTGGGILILSKNSYEVPSDGGYITVDLSSNFEFAYELPDLDWIKINDGTRGMSSHTIYFETLPNETYDSRTAIIHFYDPEGTVNENVTINQAQKDAIIISQKDFQVDSNENFISVDLNTNIEFEVIIPESSSLWISEVSNPLSRSLNPYNLQFKIEENKTYDERTGEIIISGNNNEISDTIIIHQEKSKPIEVTVSEAGTLLSHLDLNTYQNITGLIIKGEINGTDVLVIRRMSELSYLDLSGVKIKAGGASYYKPDTYLDDCYLVNDNEIGEYMFYNMTNLKTCIIPDNITVIDNHAFCKSGLEQFDIPQSVKFIKHEAFSETKIKEIIIPDNVDITTNSSNNPFENSSDTSVFDECYYLQKVTIPSHWKEIPYGYFWGCHELTEINIPEGIISLEVVCLCQCWSLKNVILPNSLKIIKHGVFYRDAIENITIPENVETIEDLAFGYCDNLREIHIKAKPNILKNISNNIFEGVNKNQIILYIPAGTLEQYILTPFGDFPNIVEE